MRRLIAIPILLSLAVTAAAATLETAIPESGISTITHEERSLAAFTFAIPAELAAGDLLEAHLELRVDPDPSEGARFVEVEAASWESGVPLIPSGRESYASELAVDRGEDAFVFLDLTAILIDALNAASSQITIVVGEISEDALPGASLSALEPDQSTWGMIRLHVK